MQPERLSGQGRVYAEVLDTSDLRVWIEDSSRESGAAVLRSEGADPALDAESALILGEALLVFARGARGAETPPPVPVGRLAVAVARVVRSDVGVRSDGALDSEVFAQALLDDLAGGVGESSSGSGSGDEEPAG